ncbi:MAG: hypothetical protein ACRCUZ_15180 [Shewanella sp.]
MINLMHMLEALLRGTSPEQINNLLFVIMALAFAAGLLLRVAHKQAAFVHYVPTLLTTLGIFGTFFGIVLGLLDFNPQNIQSSIPPLLAGLKTAFITSLAGIFSSLLFKTLTTFSFTRSTTQGTQQATPNAILQAMKNQLAELQQLNQVSDAQQQALHNLKNSLIGNEESTLFGQIKLLRTDIHDHVKQKRQQDEEALAAKQAVFTQFTERLWQQLHEVSQTLSKSATEQVIEALKQVITDFNHNLTEQFGDNFKQLNLAVAKLVEWQEQYKNQLAQMQQLYAQGVESIGTTEQAVSHISEQTQHIPIAMTALQHVMEINQHQLAELDRHLAAFALMRDEAVKAVPEIQQHVQQTVEQVAAAASSATDHYQTLLVESDAYIQTHIKTSHELLEKFSRETQKSLASVGEKLADSSQLMGEQLSIASHDFTDKTSLINECLQTRADELQHQSELMQQQLHTAITDLNSQQLDMVSQLLTEQNQMAQTLQQANQSLTTDTEQMRDSVLATTEQLRQRLSDAIEETARQQIQQAQTTFVAMETQLQGMVASLVGEHQTMTQTLQQANQALTTDTEQIRDSILATTEQLRQQLSDAIEETARQQIQQAQTTFSAMETQLQAMVGSLTNEHQSMAQTLQQANKSLSTDTEQMRDSVVRAAEQMQQHLSEVIDEAASKQIQQAQRTFDAMEDQIRDKIGLTSDAVDKQLHFIDQSMQTEIERVIQQMGSALAQVTGRFVTDYSRLTQAMHDIVKRNDA